MTMLVAAALQSTLSCTGKRQSNSVEVRCRFLVRLPSRTLAATACDGGSEGGDRSSMSGRTNWREVAHERGIGAGSSATAGTWTRTQPTSWARWRHPDVLSLLRASGRPEHHLRRLCRFPAGTSRIRKWHESYGSQKVSRLVGSPIRRCTHRCDVPPDRWCVLSVDEPVAEAASSTWMSRAALIRCASSQSRWEIGALRRLSNAWVENPRTRQVTATRTPSSARSRTSGYIILGWRPGIGSPPRDASPRLLGRGA